MTYQDLSDEQLIELHKLALGRTDSLKATVSHYNSNIWRANDENGYFTEFNGVTGEIFCGWALGTFRIFNLWQIVALCQSWGVDYSPKVS